jgi:hypothetical protein
MTTIEKLSAAINNAQLNNKPEVYAALMLFRYDVARDGEEIERLRALDLVALRNSGLRHHFRSNRVSVLEIG